MVTLRSGYKGDFECDEGPHEIYGESVYGSRVKGEKLDFKQNDYGIKITLSEFALRNNAVDTIVKLTVK